MLTDAATHLPGRPRILVVDDEPSVREFVCRALGEYYEVDGAPDGEQALAVLRGRSHQMLVTDLLMPGMNGIELLSAAREAAPGIVSLVMTAHADKSNAIAALQAGAYDFLEKPLSLDLLYESVARCWRGYRAEMENVLLMEQLRRSEVATRHLVTYSGIPLDTAYESAAMRAACEQADGLAAEPGPPILVVGEFGSGRSWFARRIHSRGRRSGLPFVDVRCKALVRGGPGPSDLDSLVAAAGHGTLLLRDVVALPEEELAALRQASESAQRPVQLIATATPQIEEAVALHVFDRELFRRLSRRRLDVPPLRERREDLPLLACQIVEMLSAEFGRQVVISDPDVFERLARHDWPANLRELYNVLERAVMRGEEDILPAHLANL